MIFSKKRKSILFKIELLFLFFFIVSTSISIALALRSSEFVSGEALKQAMEQKLIGDINSFIYRIEKEYGNLSVVNNTMADSKRKPIDDRFELVDQITVENGVVATIFVKDGDDYRRAVTSVKDENGKRASGTYLGKNSEAYNAINDGKTFIGKAKILKEDYYTVYKPIITKNSEIIGIYFVGVKISSITSLIKKRLAFTGVLMIFNSIFLIVLSVIFSSWLIKRLILNPVKVSLGILKDISEGEGDLTRRINNTTDDEIGEMIHYFNSTLEKLAQMVINIKTQSGKLSQVGIDLASNMNETAASVNEISANIQSVKNQTINQSSSLVETTASMESVTKSLEALNELIENQSVNVTQSSSSIGDMIDNIDKVTRTLIGNSDNIISLTKASEEGRSDITQMTADIEEIAKESDGLLEISKVIQNIASQTNLLAMNAAIEAARAGDSGKGFAVVADEVRKLAESAGDQAKIVSSVLKKIQDTVFKITKSTEQVLLKFDSIESEVKIVSKQGADIRNSMEEQTSKSEQVLGAINRLKDITQNVKNSSLEMLAGSKEVVKESKNLNQITQEIAQSMNEMASGAEQISIAVNKVNDISIQNKTSIEALAEEVGKFKVN